MGTPGVRHDPQYGPPAPLSEQEKLDVARIHRIMAEMRRDLARSRVIAETMVGMTEEDAVAVAESEGRFLRFAGRTVFHLDGRPRRISLRVEEGVVVRAQAG